VGKKGAKRAAKRKAKRASAPKRPSAGLVDLAPADVSPAERGRAREVVRRLRKRYPEARVMLDHRSPWQLLVSTILAAQCTDAKVNEVAPELFERFPDPQAMAGADIRTLERIVRPTGFFRNKSRSIRNASRAIVERFGGKLPRTMEEMLTLPGVARKTANVVLMDALGVTSGVVVDTHNIRLSGRLGLVKTADPVEIERFWIAAAERKDWPAVGHLLYSHGQQVCGRKPRCGECVVGDLCPSADID
jgi:endonuclease-3